MGFRIPWAEFQISNPRVLESTSKNFRESGISGIWIPLDGEGGGGGGGEFSLLFLLNEASVP